MYRLNDKIISKTSIKFKTMIQSTMNRLTAFTFLIFILGLSVKAYEFEAIYGEDNRVEIDRAPFEISLLSDAVAVFIRPNHLIEQDDDTFIAHPAMTLKRRGRVCEGEKYWYRPAVGNCTAFLIAPKVLVTANHCVTSENYCKTNRIVFGYKGENPVIEKKNVYQCTKIIKKKTKERLTDDWALVILKNRVKNIQPLKYKKTKLRARSNKRVFAIGSPMGLPLQAHLKGRAVRTRGGTFDTNLDTFGGNSGSPVFNSITKKVEGILIEGDDDYFWDSDERCYREKTDNKGHKEIVLKINAIPKLKKILKRYR